LSGLVQSRVESFPAGTFTVNFLGCFLLSLVIFLSESHGLFSNETRLFLTIGVMGSFTTMSAFSYETFRLMEDGRILLVGGNVLGTIILMPGTVYLGKLTAAGWPGG